MSTTGQHDSTGLAATRRARTRAARLFDHLRRDVGFGLRTAARTPWFAVVAVLTLALGLGATTSVIGVIDVLLLRPPAGVSDPTTLVTVYGDDSSTPEPEHWGVSYPQFRELQVRQRPLEGLATDIRMENLVRGPEETRFAKLAFVSGNYFELLGVTSTLGRLPTADDDTTSTPTVAALSHEYWTRVFGADPAILGAVVYINDVPVRFIGVTPPGFNGQFLDYIPNPELWLPVQAYKPIYNTNRLERADFGFTLVGRLSAGVSMPVAAEQLSVLMSQLDLPLRPEAPMDAMTVRSLSQSRIYPGRRDVLMRLLSSLLGVAVLLLLVGCFGVCNFLVSRTLARRRELSLRLALGASRGRILAQVLTESSVFALLGALLGLLVATAIARGLSTFPDLFGRITLDLGTVVDRRVFLVALLLAVAVTLLIGMIPAWLASRGPLYGRTKPSSPGWAWSRILRSPRQLLLVGQVSVAVVLAIAASLFIRSLSAALAVNPGVARTTTVLARLSSFGLAPDEAGRFHDALLDRLRQHAAIRDAAIGMNEPFITGSTEYEAPGRATEPRSRTGLTFVSPHYFDVLGVQLSAGRALRAEDATRGEALVINHVLAEQLWPAGDAVGRSLRFPNFSDAGTLLFGSRDRVVVGVVRLDACRGLWSEPHACVWGPLLATSANSLIVTPVADLGTVSEVIRDTVRSLSDNVAVLQIRTLEDHVADQFADVRVAATVSAGLALAGLVLVAIGCAALFRVVVVERHRDIGIRLAIGASVRQVAARIAVQATILTVGGAALGVVLFTWIRPLIEGQVHRDVVTQGMFDVVPVVSIVAVSVLASVVATRRALRIDLAQLFRHE